MQSDFSKTNAAFGLMLAMTVMDVVEGYQHMDLAIEAFEKVDVLYKQAVKEYSEQRQLSGRCKTVILNPFMLWVVVLLMVLPTFSRFATLWRCCKLILQQSTAVISSMDLSK